MPFRSLVFHTKTQGLGSGPRKCPGFKFIWDLLTKRKEWLLALQSDKITNLDGMLHFIRELEFHNYLIANSSYNVGEKSKLEFLM